MRKFLTGIQDFFFYDIVFIHCLSCTVFWKKEDFCANNRRKKKNPSIPLAIFPMICYNTDTFHFNTFQSIGRNCSYDIQYHS